MLAVAREGIKNKHPETKPALIVEKPGTLLAIAVKPEVHF